MAAMATELPTGHHKLYALIDRERYGFDGFFRTRLAV